MELASEGDVLFVTSDVDKDPVLPVPPHPLIVRLRAFDPVQPFPASAAAN